MTPEAQRIAIETYCGWKDVVTDNHNERVGVNIHAMRLVHRGEYRDSYQRVPDYLNDLNAMQAAEYTAGMEVIKAMRFYLWKICDQMTSHHATAPQRAEAFLKATGLWTDP